MVNIICDMQDRGLGPRASKRLQENGYGIDLRQYVTSDVDSNESRFFELSEDLRGCQLAIIRVHAGLTYFKKFDRLRERIVQEGVPLMVFSEMSEDVSENRGLFGGSQDDYHRIRSYLEMGGDDNEYGLYTWLLREIDGIDIPVQDPRMDSMQGYYEPGIGETDSPLASDGPRIAVLFNQINLRNGDRRHIDALIGELRKKGASVTAVFLNSNPNDVTGSIGINGTVRKYLMEDGRPKVDSVILTLPFSQLCLSDPGDGTAKDNANIFAELGVPIIQAPTMFNSREGWESDPSGLGPYELSMSIFWPEYDGQIISVPLASSEMSDDGGSVSTPIDDRVSAIADLAINWAVLRNTPVKERRIAILLHQNPPRRDMVGGAFGLDAAESTARLLRVLRRRGYSIGRIPSTGKGLTRRLLDGVCNDTEWLSAEDMMKLSADRIPRSQYCEWLSGIDKGCSERMVSDWGDPPGEIGTVDGITVIPGFVEGNVYIGLQPNRGLIDESVDIYHSQDITPPHSYLAFYRWLTEEFKAQAVIHMGCHGTLEWLPGKGTGLSSKCFPDIVFGHLPHIYPYAMSNPGEGMHAKRRNGAVIIDHLIPSMTRAGTYDELSDLEVSLQDYLRSRSSGSEEKMEHIAVGILEDCRKMNMLSEIGLPDDCSLKTFRGSIEKLYDYICDLKDNLIKNGLHILGEVPAEERMDQMIYSILRVRNGDIPSLREAVGRSMGYDLDALEKDRSGTSADGRTNGEILDDIDSKSMAMISSMRRNGFDAGSAIEDNRSQYGCGFEDIVSLICEQIVPKLKLTTEELDNLANALDGRYVLPGPSGCITRGNGHLLPSGRNFFSIDPASIPTRSSWDIGSRMAEQMVRRFVDEKGTYPKQVGVVIWATDTMKTGGDDIAYVLSLLGLRPVWSSNGGAVTGLEVMPVSELGRPRIDVTMRISGLFRDSFPNLVQMIDEGVRRISELEESDDDNYLLAHLRKDITESIAGGMDPIAAKRAARVRIFGDPPGNYGGGVDSLIDSSRWSDRSELAEAYVEWGGYGYGTDLKGEDMKEFFRRRMSEVDITVKNHESRELDAFDNDDDYVFLGGMNATVESCKGEQPMSVMGDSSDPSSLKLRSLAEEGKFIYRSRVLNPKWLEGLKRHGYRGVQEVSNLVEFSFGWDSTSGIMEDWMYQAVTDRFVLDEDNRQWIQENNPEALRQITSRLLEAAERGMWNADDETVEALRSIFVDNDAALERMNDRS